LTYDDYVVIKRWLSILTKDSNASLHWIRGSLE